MLLFSIKYLIEMETIKISLFLNKKIINFNTKKKSIDFSNQIME